MNAIYEGDKYVANAISAKRVLKRYGVAIIPNVISENECNIMLSQMWDFFEHISQEWDVPIRRNDSRTWRGFYDLFPLHSQLFQHWNVGHCQAVWTMRTNVNILNVFCYLWLCSPDELLVSFDGMSMCPPPEATNRGWDSGRPWYHTDQSYCRNDFECIQSWITANDVNEGDATLTIMERSHKFHSEFGQVFNKRDTSDWYKLSSEEKLFYEDKGCEYKHIKCPKGSLVLWDSRTIHCGTNPKRNRRNHDFRAVIYLCYMPRSLCSNSNIEKKKKLFNELRTCSHWPHKPKLFPKMPPTYSICK